MCRPFFVSLEITMSLNPIPHIYSQLVSDFKALGVEHGQTLMLHSSMSAVGAVMGGPNVVLQALFEVLGIDGTLMMYVGWQDIPDFVLELPPKIREVYYAEHPAFDPATARAVRDHGILAEFFRTWPNTKRSQNPEASMVAFGRQAEYISADHPFDYGYGAGSPLAKLVEMRGYVLMLGAPLDAITLLHYAENRAKLRHKNVIHYQCPILRDGQKVWIDVEDFDTGDPHDDYSFEQIAHEYLKLGRVKQGKIGSANSYLFDAADLTQFAIGWLEENFG